MSWINILEKLVSFNTIKDKENEKIMSYIESYCNDYGFRTIYKDKVLILTNSDTLDNISIGFVGHTDTVNAVGWDYNPFSLTKKGTKLIGLGTCDMKGGIACILDAISKVDFSKTNRKMMLIFTYDEEIGFGGIKEVINLDIKLPQKFIIGEPTNNEILLGSKGLIEYKVTFEGIKAHSSTPFKGKNAIFEAMNFVSELKEFYEKEIKNDVDESFSVPYSTFNVGMINGGVGINSVPDSCEIFFDFRTINKNEEKITQFVDKLCRKYKTKFEIIEKISAFKCESSVSNKVKTAPFITEASFLGGERIILGPGPVNPHEKNEYVEVDSLEKCVNQYIEIIKNA